MIGGAEMKIISDAEQKKISSHGTNALTTALLEAQLGSCEKELAAERERIIEEIEKHDKSNCTVCPFLKNETECMYNFFHCTCIWWQYLKAKIREGL